MAKKPSTEVAVQEEKTTAVALPEGMDMAEIMGDAGVGVSGMDVGDVALPYISILQGLSPQVNPAHSLYKKGAMPSMFYNTVSGKIYEGREGGLVVVPVAYERKFVEWVDRDAGGGWVGDHTIDSDILDFCTKDDKGRLRLKNNNLIVETAYQYCLVQDPDDGNWFQAVFAMKSTALKKNRKWNNELVTTKIPGTQKIAPRWLYKYKVTTIPESKGNNSWWNFEIERLDMVDKDLYKFAKSFNTLVEQGAVTRSKETDAPVGDAPAADKDDQIPF